MGFQPSLCLAVENNTLTASRYLLKEGANVNAKCESVGRTLLQHAVTNRYHQDMVELLIEEGAGIEAKDNNGDTALLIAAKKKSKAVMRCLLAHRANTEAEMETEETSLHIAVHEESTAMVQMLLDGGADVEARNIENLESFFKTLEEGSANAEAMIAQGDRALHIAIRTGNTQIVHMLLEADADTEVKNAAEKTAMHLAVLEHEEEKGTTLLEFLLRKGAHRDAQDGDGFTIASCRLARSHHSNPSIAQRGRGY